MKKIVFVVFLLFSSFCLSDTFNTTSSQTIALNLHNQARKLVSPPAQSSIQNVTYNSTLATHASTWANNCQYQHSSGSGEGENLYAVYPSTSNQDTLITNATNLWVAENVYYAVVNKSCLNPNTTCGHYTQVIWSTTTSIGCGFQVCNGSTSPFGNSLSWSFVVCRYNPPGNYIGQGAYTPNTSSCTLNNQCAANTCGAISCGQIVNCACTNGLACSNQTTGDSCSCNVTSSCSAQGFTCGNQYLSSSTCRGFYNCGSCPNGGLCTNGQCQSDPCFNVTCGSFSTCVSGTCQCNTGYNLVNGQCVAVQSALQGFSETLPTSGSPMYFTNSSGQIYANVNSGVNAILAWTATSGLSNDTLTRFFLSIYCPSGSFGFGYRHNQGSSRPNDMLYFLLTSASSNINLGLNYIYYSTIYNYATYSVPWNYAAYNQVNVTTSYDSVTGAATGTIIVGGYTITGTMTGGFSTTGDIAFYASGPSQYVKNLGFATYSSFLVSMYGCISDTDWVAMFKRETGNTNAQVQARSSGTNGNCNKKAAELLVIETLVVAEGSSAASLTSTFVTAITTSPLKEQLGVSSVSILSAQETAGIAGIGSTGVVTSVLPGAGTAAGSVAAGGSSGLSGGAIAGIVIGVVAGSILIVLGVVIASIIVVGVVVIIIALIAGGGVGALAFIATRDSDNNTEESIDNEEQNYEKAGVRKSIMNIFKKPKGGVDVMGYDESGTHQSISARSPAIKTDV